MVEATEDEENKKNNLILYYENKKHILILKERNYFLSRKIQQIKEWLKFIILGFNSSFYDINITKEYGFLELISPITSVIKKGNKYNCISTNKFSMLDQMFYCPAGTSLDKFIKSRECHLTKGHFPYSWLTSYNK